MPAPKNLASYDVAYYEALRQAVDREVRIPCETVNEARYLRLRFYGFRAALQENPGQEAELALLASGLHFEVDGKELVLRPEDPKVKLIRAALETKDETGT